MVYGFKPFAFKCQHAPPYNWVISALEMDYLSVGECMGYLLLMQAALR